MNTDPAPLDLLAGSIALEAVDSATTREELCSAVGKLAAVLCLPHFLLLHLHGPDHQVAAVLHNLPGKSEVHAIATHDAIKRALLGSRIPQILTDELAIPEFGHAIVAMWPSGATTCVLLLGRATPWEEAPTTDLLGIISLVCSHAVDILVSTQKSETPLSRRELECLAFAAAGSSAKETSRHLGLSPRTVEEYLSRCKERLGIRSTLAAAATAVRRGWMSYEEIDAASKVISPRCGAKGVR